MTLVEVARQDDRRKSLEEVRNHLAAAIDVAEPRELPSLVKQFRETLAELEALGIAKEVSASDDLAAKRKARRAGAKASRASAR